MNLDTWRKWLMSCQTRSGLSCDDENFVRKHSTLYTWSQDTVTAGQRQEVAVRTCFEKHIRKQKIQTIQKFAYENTYGCSSYTVVAITNPVFFYMELFVKSGTSVPKSQFPVQKYINNRLKYTECYTYIFGAFLLYNVLIFLLQYLVWVLN